MNENRSFYKRRDLGAKYNFPTASNPFTSVREALGLTVDQVARDLSMHRNSILRTEQGQYDAPQEDLLEYYGLNTSQRESVLSNYNRWRRLMRQANYGLLDPDWPILAMQPTVIFSDLHPFKTWRLQSGVKALNTIAKAFALHQGILFRYESQSNLCNFTPLVILEALKDSGYSSELTGQLEEAFQRFKAVTRDSIKVTPIPVGPVGRAS